MSGRAEADYYGEVAFLVSVRPLRMRALGKSGPFRVSLVCRRRF